MADSNGNESPLKAAADVAGRRATETFGLLGNEMRLAILVAIWEAYEPFGGDTSDPTEPGAVSFEDLQERIGVDDPDQLTYHLAKLEGAFVEQTGAGYALTARAGHVLRAVLAGTLTEQTSFEGEPIDVPCDHCGGQVVIDYRDTTLVERCTRCEGRWGGGESPSGTLRSVPRPPAGLANRTPQEFYRDGNTLDRYDAMARLEGTCPDCSGTVTNRFAVCDDHDAADGTVCEHCGSFWEVQLQTVCEVCKAFERMGPVAPIHTDLRVLAFYHDHGVDPNERYDVGDLAGIIDTIDELTVLSEDPMEVLITIAIDGDRLEMTLDDDATIIDVTEGP